MRKRVLRTYVFSTALILNAFTAPPVWAEPKLQAVKPCAVTTERPCLDSITATNANGEVTNAILLMESRRFPLSYAGQFTESVDTYEWRIPGTKHQNGNDRISVGLMYFPYGAKYCWLENQCMTGVDELILHAVGAWWDSQAPVVEFPHKPSNFMCGTKANPSLCGLGWGTDKRFQYSFNIKTGNDFKFSHANGEALDGSITESTTKDNENILTFTGKPVDVSFVFTTDLNPSTIYTQPKADVTLAHLNAYIQSTRSDQSKWLERCDFGRGMSLWYSGQLISLPAWYPEDQAVGIRIASAHLRVDGTNNIGAFNISVPLETAKCLWGVDLSKAVTAFVSASYADSGTPEIVTTSTSVSKGFFNIKASGFHFSSPTFKVRLNQVQSLKSNESGLPIAASASPSPKPISVKKTSITCTKGKTTKKVTAINPKCPTGYKKK